MWRTWAFRRVNDSSASELVSQLLYLDELSSTQPILMLINSGGGTVTSGLAIYDVMQFIQMYVLESDASQRYVRMRGMLQFPGTCAHPLCRACGVHGCNLASCRRTRAPSSTAKFSHHDTPGMPNDA
eukprot:8977472-Pyramimonas_sp.AAC.1